MSADLQVFVYGTLKPGGYYWTEFCEGRVTRKVEARVRGQLFDLGVGYPGLLLGGNEWVYGYVLTLTTPKDLERLDYLEGFEECRPADENEYLRKKALCYTLDGAEIGLVWIYEMSNATKARYSLAKIEDGNWPVDQTHRNL